MIYNIRHDRKQRVKIRERIERDRRVSQGWGGGKNGDLDLRHDDFVSKTYRYYELRTTRIATNLLRMMDFRDGDILVLPHLPEYGTVSLHIVDGDFPDCYEYEQADPTHLNHGVRVRESFGLHGQISVRNVELRAYNAKLPYLRLPVLPIPDLESTFQNIISALRAEQHRQFTASALDDFLVEAAEKMASCLTEQMQAIPASGGDISFEAVCERILVRNGYRIVARNQFDGRGGDADLVCTRPRSKLSRFETGDVTLYVQIKKHQGETDVHAVNQVLGMLQGQPNGDGCVMSAADEFTNEARELAQKHGIALLSKIEICRLLMPFLSEYLPPE